MEGDELRQILGLPVLPKGSEQLVEGNARTPQLVRPSAYAAGCRGAGRVNATIASTASSTPPAS